MEKEKFDKSEANFIAKLILQRLDIVPKNKIDFEIPKQYQEVISAIEKIEKTWSLSLSNQEHSFGRKEKNEKIGLWSVPKMSAMVLAELICLTNSKQILEIGTSAGYSTLFLSAGAISTKGNVFTIELLKDKIELAKKNFKEAKTKNIELIESEASKVLSNWKDKKIDFVFLDADKENYAKYLDLLLPIMNLGGIIVADNINDYGHMMADYLQRVSGTHLPKSRCDSRVISTYLAQLDNGLMITRKISN